MARRWRAWIGPLWCLAVAVQLAGPARPAAAEDGYAKYYVVTASFQGQPEDLTEIAARFLGRADRAGELLTLNQGRRQPDGAALTGPGPLRAGWLIVLPWDAAGDGVRHGLLPAAPAAPARGASADWARRLVAGEQVWAVSRGAGVLVAVIDSGVDATEAGLSGRVLPGADVMTGDARGDLDAVGTGTAMAGLIAGGAASASGVAPAARILPVRVESAGAAPEPAAVATAIEVAVSAGATVIALGSTTDLTDPPVAAAVALAASYDVVVVVSAPASGTVTGTPVATPALLLVGGIDRAGRPGAAYLPGAVQVVAPGVGIAVPDSGATGTREISGTRYAVAFVAGAVALVRAAHPGWSAAEAARRIRATAVPLGSAVPDSATGWGTLDAATAVTAPVTGFSTRPGIPPPAAPADQGGWWWPLLLALALAAVAAAAAATWWFRRARTRRVPDGSPAPAEDPGASPAAEASPDLGVSSDPGASPHQGASS